MSATPITELTTPQLQEQGQNSPLLVEHALNFLQAYIGTTWNDHGQSDPGITLLESLAHSISELSRRLALPVPDLLAVDTTDDAERNLIPYYLAKDLLPSNPVTLADHRRHLIDIPGIQQAWLTTNQQGATDIQIDLEETWANRSEHEKRALCAEVRTRYIRERNINQDLASITIIQKQQISVKLHLAFAQLDTLTSTIAEVFRRLQQALAPDVKKHSLSALRQQGKTGDQILDGPWLAQGLITEAALDQVRMTDWIYSSQLLNTLTNLPDLTEIKTIALGNAETTIRYDPWRLKVKDGQRPSLAIDPTLAALTLEIAGQQYPLTDAEKAAIKQQLAEQPAQAHNQTIATTEVLTHYIKGQHQALSQYSSIQHTFPKIYQVAESRLARKLSKTDAPVMQLKGYLSLFDQILADQYQQLDNLKTALALPENSLMAHLGSHFEAMLASETLPPARIEQFWHQVRQLPQTRRSRPITDVAGQHHLLGENHPHYQQHGFQPIAEPAFSYGQLERLRRSLNHLLGRFSETRLDSNLLQYAKIIQPYLHELQQAPNAIDEDGHDLLDKLVMLKEITDTARILEHYPQLSKYRSGGFDYLETPDATAGQTGLSRRLLAFLGSPIQRKLPLATQNRESIYLLEGQLLQPTNDTATTTWQRDRLYFVIPDWPTRHANPDYQTLLKNQIRQQSPVQLETYLIKLPRREMSLFERLYYAWLNALNQRPLNIQGITTTVTHTNEHQLASYLRAFTQDPNTLIDQILGTLTEQALQTAINSRLSTSDKLSGYEQNTLITPEQLKALQDTVTSILEANPEQAGGLTAADLLFAISHAQITTMANPKAIGTAIINQDFIIGYQPLDSYRPTFPIGSAIINPDEPKHPTFSVRVATPL